MEERVKARPLGGHVMLMEKRCGILRLLLTSLMIWNCSALERVVSPASNTGGAD
jgi:hypothetical protein